MYPAHLGDICMGGVVHYNEYVCHTTGCYVCTTFGGHVWEMRCKYVCKVMKEQELDLIMSQCLLLEIGMYLIIMLKSHIL